MTWVEHRSPPLSAIYDQLSVPPSLSALFPAPSLPRKVSSTSAVTATSASSYTSSAYATSPSNYSSALMPPPPLPRKRKLESGRGRVGSTSPGPESSASPSSHAGDSEYDPAVPSASGSRAPRQKRIQSKPVSSAAPTSPTASTNNMRIGPNGRPMSREQLRKANHSLIERRRREKINVALSELRSMVPGLGEDGGKGGEFKLEVLERTVIHMRELKQQIADLENHFTRRQRKSEEDMDVDEEPRSLSSRQRTSHSSQASRSSQSQSQSHHSNSNHSPQYAHHSHQRPAAHTQRNSYTYASHSPRSPHHSQSTPPSPSMTPPPRHGMSPDPNETEPELDLPPALTLAHRPAGSDNTDSSGHTASPNPHPPSIASLLSSSASAQSNRNIPVPSGPRVGQASPNIYLPFPTPSPTSPFLTYHGSSASTSSSMTGPPEPSPFMAPVGNISLFGGALDTPNTLDGERGDREMAKQPSPPDLTMPPPGHQHPSGRDLAPEEAANLLLAFSSPETLRPAKTGSTPLMSALAMPPGQRRNLDSEEFSLDSGNGNSKTSLAQYSTTQHRGPRTQGKTARDILRM